MSKPQNCDERDGNGNGGQHGPVWLNIWLWFLTELWPECTLNFSNDIFKSQLINKDIKHGSHTKGNTWDLAQLRASINHKHKECWLWVNCENPDLGTVFVFRGHIIKKANHSNRLHEKRYVSVKCSWESKQPLKQQITKLIFHTLHDGIFDER